MNYCDPADLYSYGLPRGALPNEGRLAASASAAADTIELDGHGFALNGPVSFRAEAGGSLPEPLDEGTTYYAIPVTPDAFSVAAAEGGAAIDLTTDGERVVVIAPLPIDAAIAWASRIIDDSLPAHLVPLEEPLPEIVRMTCAELAAGKLLTYTGREAESLTAMVDQAQKRLMRWGKGVPIRGTNAPKPANLAASATVPYKDPRGWNRYGGL